MADETYLQCLNPAQVRAVRHPHDIPLQILAGPGSGKTKVLTSRIAYLILHEHVQPSSICAVTFTNKAAREMKERLTKVIGKAKVDEVKMGTFHALCALFLRRYPTRVGIKSNFTVCDADESKKILKKLLGSYKDYLEERNITLDVRSVTSIISKAKSRGESWRALAVRSTSTIELASQTGHDLNRIIAELYEAYEKYLRENNSLDFDDLLVYGVELFSRNKEVIAWCTHVLVDEFQDTNTLQYELMRHIASVSRCVTIVGDPDQSIYGWRSAEVANLAKMRIDFPSTVQILLEENYRSTASILRACMSIVAQDHSRIQKTLHTSHPDGCCPVLQCFPSEQDEAACIAREIKRLSASSGGMLGWEDFVILLRMNSLSRSLESALRKEGIPCRVLKGQKFFERLEIKDLLAYLQVVDNPDFVPAFERVINVPPRGIGDKTLGEILRTAQGRRLSPVALVEHIYDSKIPDIKPSIKRKVGSFVRTVRELRLAAQKGRMPADIIRKLISLTEYEDHLKKTQPDSDARWENVMELMSFASEVQTDLVPYALEDLSSGSGPETDKDWDDMPNETEAAQFNADGLIELKHSAAEGPGNREALSESNPLRLFLQASQLSGDSGDGGEGGEKEKVTISTCHSAKGLEWPVVFIPAVEEGTFPFALSEDLNEERRLLYVACTRAQNLLYLSHCNKRLVAGRQIDRKLSAFVASVIEEAPDTFTDEPPELSYPDLAQMAAVLGREAPNKAAVREKLAAFYKTDRYHQYMRTSEKALPTNFAPAGAFNPTGGFKSTTPGTSTSTGPRLASHSTSAQPRPRQVSSSTASGWRRTPAHNLPIQAPTSRLFATEKPKSSFTAPDVSQRSVTGSSLSTATVPRARPASSQKEIKKPMGQQSSFPAVVLSDRTNPATLSGKHSEPPAQHAKPAGQDMPPTTDPAPERPVKRRLGMGRFGSGYTNKKFKLPQT